RLLRLTLPLSFAQRLRAFSQQENTSLFVTMMAAFAGCTYQYTHQDDICIGSSVANRHWPATERLLGMLVNNVVLRSQMPAHRSFRQWLEHMHEVSFAAYQNQ